MPPDPSPLRLGILGGGQLARMTAVAALRLGIRVRILTDTASGPEADFADVTVGDWTDAETLRAFADGCTAVTCESEWAPVEALVAAAPGVAVWPAAATLAAVRHKGRQRDALAAAGLPQPLYARAATLAEAQDATARFGGRVVCKQFEGSYDGYGNATCRTPTEVAAAWDRLAAADGLLVEAFVPFEAELAVTVARSPNGETAVYPVVRSEHRDHRLHAATLPSGVTEAVEAEAQRVALAATEALATVGVATVELFFQPGGPVLINEIAPRPHNTAHGTIEACHTSQFENAVRAVLGLPLGSAALRVPAACTVNVIGGSAQANAADLEAALRVEGATVHLYGKTESHPRRKMGHVTATGATPDNARRRAEVAAEHLRQR
ncbi:MAG TPA: 5-(carboxyamino)imidazole ribonucleotide synthase [Rubricoccaceae bacterium]|jgi:5-(carboxyamino)imidazole ribonucleotide synthase